MSNIKSGDLLRVVRNSSNFPTGKGNDELVELFYGGECIPGILLNDHGDAKLSNNESCKESEMNSLGEVIAIPLSSVVVAIKEVKLIVEREQEDSSEGTPKNRPAGKDKNINVLLSKLVVKHYKSKWAGKIANKMLMNPQPQHSSKLESHIIDRKMWVVLIGSEQPIIQEKKKVKGMIANVSELKTGKYLLDPARLEKISLK